MLRLTLILPMACTGYVWSTEDIATLMSRCVAVRSAETEVMGS
jgi:hypothetical protein